MADEPEVHAEEPAKEAGHKDAGNVAPGKGDTSAYFKKHKAAIIALIVGILAAAYFVLKNKGSTTATAATPAAATAGIDPATGYEYGSPADLAALGASGSQATTPASPSATNNIDPATGYVYGSPQDIAALDASTSGAASGGTGTATGTFTPNPLTVGSFSTQQGTYSPGTPISTFQQAFAATGSNAGQIVPGGTGQPIPLPKGKSYTS
jgi:hypothetical protein